jgi:hypothetical protein
VFCRYEGEEFPQEEFKKSPKYGWVHEREPKHLTSGELVDDLPSSPDIPGLPEEAEPEEAL